MRCYVSHPIAGRSEEDKVHLELVAMDYVRRRLGMEPVLPRPIPPACGQTVGCGIVGRHLPGDQHTIQCYMRGDLRALLDCDLVLMMPGWQWSAGCRDELNTALIAGISVVMYDGVSIRRDGIGDSVPGARGR